MSKNKNEFITISVKVPKSIIQKIDAEAKPENGVMTSRSHIINKILFDWANNK